jgi:two-component system chemotaxis response regulator CheY
VRGLTKSCLIVDDSRVIRTVAKKILVSLEFETREAENGQVALQSCVSAMPDAVLLDWNMPVMNGLDFLRELRQMPGGDQPIVLFCTTENDLERIQEALETGADEYIMKPFDSDIIEAKMSQVGLM